MLDVLKRIPTWSDRLVYQRNSARVRFSGGCGFDLAGIVDRPQSPDTGQNVPDVPVAVFTHCFTCNKDLKAIAKISRFLSTMGIAVLRYDMTGLGNSDGDFSDTNFSTNLRDLAAAIEFAESHLGRVTGLIGHSFGGAASLGWAAGMLGLQCHPVAIVTIAAPSDTVHLSKLLTWMNPAIVQDGSGEVEIGGRRWNITRQMIDDFASHRLADALPTIRGPVMAFHSPMDATVGYDHALRIAGLIQDESGLPGCSIVTLRGADHLLVDNPQDADYVAEATAAFLRRNT